MAMGWDRVKVFQEFSVREETGITSSKTNVPGLKDVLNSPP